MQAVPVTVMERLRELFGVVTVMIAMTIFVYMYYVVGDSCGSYPGVFSSQFCPSAAVNASRMESMGSLGQNFLQPSRNISSLPTKYLPAEKSPSKSSENRSSGTFTSNKFLHDFEASRNTSNNDAFITPLNGIVAVSTMKENALGHEIQNLHRSKYGFFMAFSFSDQLTGSVYNLNSLMCLATKLGGIRVVEPFIVHAEFGLNASMDWTKEIRFRDVYDLDQWTQHIQKMHYPQFVPFDIFLKEAPRKVLLVETGFLPCGNRMLWNRCQVFCDINGFQLVSKVCLDYKNGNAYTLKSLRQQIYSQYKPEEVVVIFDKYGGINWAQRKGPEPYRIYAKLGACGRSGPYVLPSKSVYFDARTYIKKYLNGSSSYITVMLRMEHILIRNGASGKGHENKVAIVSKTCLANVLKRLREVQNKTGISTIYLACDVGVFGSGELRNAPLIEKPLLQEVRKFISILYSNTTLEEWENTISSVGLGRSRNPGYIAMLQKLIAAKGDVLILAGSTSGSAFQHATKILHNQIHKHPHVIELDIYCK